MTRDLWARRPFFSDDHEDVRASVRGLLAREVVPYGEAWDAAGIIPREPWRAAGEAGLLGLGLEDDYAFRCVVIEECARVGATSYSSGLTVHADIALPYVVDMASPEQERRWVPGLVSGEMIGAIAMTEPGTGSDLRGIRTSARRDGDAWVLNGTKTFITNGINSDLVVVVARTDPSPEAGSLAFSLFVVERGMPGFERGRNLDKVGLKAQDTAELFFEDVVLTDDHLLSEVGDGMRQLMVHLPLERIGIAVTACAGARAALAWTIDYVRERAAFGRTVADFQHTQFAIAEMVTALDVAQAYVDQAVLRLNAGELTAVEAAQAKWWATEMHKTVVDRCVQLFGGYGYMTEYPIARAYLDTRVTTIYGGTTEIMKQIVARDVLGVR